MKDGDITGNEPAAPNGMWGQQDNTGLTIRQHFAAMAMQGLCASGFYTDKKLQLQSEAAGSNISIALTTASVDIADDLIEALNK